MNEALTYPNKINEIDALQARINEYRPLSVHARQQLREYYKIGLTYSSNAIEGNSLTETETKIILEDGITIGGKTLKEHLEAVGHADAYEHLYTIVGTNTISEKDILGLHRLLYRHINEKKAGVYRSEQVIITGTDFMPPAPKKVPSLMHTLIETLPSLRTEHHPVEFAALLHKEFVEIHPFVDGNDRTARLLMNLALLQAGYCITIIPPVVRHHYIACLRQAHGGNSSYFVNFISNMVCEAQRDYIRLLNSLQD